MSTTSLHYVHCLVSLDQGKGLAWYSPAELSGHMMDFCFAIPIQANGEPFPEGYWIQVLLNDGKRELLTFEFGQRADGSFALMHPSADIVFQEPEGPRENHLLRYAGKFHHGDFAYRLLGLEPVKDEIYELMLGGDEVFLVGCHPATNYTE